MCGTDKLKKTSPIDFLCQVPELTVAPHPALTSHISGIFNFLAELKFFWFFFQNQGEAKEGAAREGETSKHPGRQVL